VGCRELHTDRITQIQDGRTEKKEEKREKKGRMGIEREEQKVRK